MKTSCLLLLISGALLAACTATNKAPADEPVSLKTYFTPQDSGVQSGGVRVIPINTPKGQFNVWTKRIGNNPKIKLLLLQGGPGCTHEYWECMESFLPAEGIEFIYREADAHSK